MMTNQAITRAYDQVRDELRRVDGKATTLLSLIGATLAGVVALSTRSMPTAALVVLGCAAAPIAAAVAVLLCAVRPSLGGALAPGSWLWAAEHGAAALTTLPPADDEQSAAEHVVKLARIARAKYRRIRLAVTLLAAGLAVLPVALVLGLIHH